MCANCSGPFWPQSAFDDIFWRKISREYPDMGASVLDGELDLFDEQHTGWEYTLRSDESPAMNQQEKDPLGQGLEDD